MDCSMSILPCSSLFPRVCSNSCPSCQWCHPTISSSVAPFSSCSQSFPASGSSLMSHFFASASAIIPSNKYSGLISFRIDWFDLLAVQGTLKSLLRPHSSKASILWLSAFFMVQLSHPYMTTGKTIALTICTFAGKIMSLFFNVLSRFVMASLTWCAWVWVNCGSWWWTGRHGVLRFMESQRVRHDWMTELNWGLS